MAQTVPATFLDMLQLADSSWQSILRAGLDAMMNVTPQYLPELEKESYLPTRGRLFAAFAQPLQAVRHVLVGEGPYPRPESATGVCFMDGAVDLLWSEKGLSKQVNRATSLRNFMKMLLVAEGELAPDATSSEHMAHIALEACAHGSTFIQTLPELQANLTRYGFLLLNAALVFRPHVPPLKEAKAWQPFLQTILAVLADHADTIGQAPPTLVLWGKIAEQFKALPSNERFPKAISEHPYNLTFIESAVMQALFGPMHLLRRQDALHTGCNFPS